MGSAPNKPYNEEIGNEICEIIASSNKSLTTILNQKDYFPKFTTFFKWVDENKSFANMYARAKDIQADYLAEEILEISDDSKNDTIEGEYGPMENKEWVNRSKLRVDSRKWIASKLKPKKYGDKLELDGKLSDKKTVRIIMGKKKSDENHEE